MAARLQDFYNETVVPRLRSELKIDNAMQVPRITKITINMGVGEAVADRKVPCRIARRSLSRKTSQPSGVCGVSTMREIFSVTDRKVSPWPMKIGRAHV